MPAGITGRMPVLQSRKPEYRIFVPRHVGGRALRSGLSLMLAVGLAGAGMAGCRTRTNPGPDERAREAAADGQVRQVSSADERLRELATAYIRRGLKYPENPAVRAQATEASEKVLGADARILIREALKDEHPGVRFAACMALGRLGDSDAAPQLRGLLNDSDPSVRIGVYFALEKLGDASHRVEWTDLLRKHENPVVRRNAAMALGMLGDKKALALLQVVSTKDKDEGVRLQALEAQALLGDRDAINHFFQDSFASADYRQPFALLALGHLEDSRVAPALRARLATAPYLEARLAAARSLGALGYPEGYALALGSLNWSQTRTDLPDDPPENQIMRVRSMAAMALGEIGDPKALDALAKRMQTPDDPRVQLAAATAVLTILNRAT